MPKGGGEITNTGFAQEFTRSQSVVASQGLEDEARKTVN